MKLERIIKQLNQVRTTSKKILSCLPLLFLPTFTLTQPKGFVTVSRCGTFDYWSEKNGSYVRKPFADNDGHTKLTAGDFNQDGALDFLSTSNTGNVYLWIKNNKSFSRKVVVSCAANSPNDICSADFNGDGTRDFIIDSKSKPGDNLYCYINKGGKFLRRFIGQTSRNVTSLEASDVNKDGTIDIITVELKPGSLDGHIYVWYNQNNLKFVKSAKPIAYAGYLASLGVGNFLSETDIIIGSEKGYNDGKLLFYSNGSKHIIKKNVDISVITLADMDNDGKPEILTVGRLLKEQKPAIHCWKYQNPSFALRTISPLEYGITDIAAGF